ncbi:A-kinase anchor protein 9 isoform X3 [Erpetoichthys calabaricus]|uniref:A-kinase anchor protein 9 isoform X3 n=1 Tax=Erpetoichthys calabaricus TaxID=27687 RepID=UPI002233E94E|nr:A-kinase anchor protein 9 isoform X3 [Erpetoichthys calabaricus]
MEDEERQKKLEAGKAKLAEYRQKKAQADGQKRLKKKKKVSGCTEEGHIQDCPDHVHSQSGETSQQSTAKGASTDAADFSISRTLRSGDTIKHDQIYTIEPESELSTTADDYSSEVHVLSNIMVKARPAPEDVTREEDIVICENHSKHEAQTSQTRLEMMEEELAEKQQTIEELSRELEEMRTAYGTEGLQQLQDFEAAVKQRDEIITQLTANLQLAHKERDEIMKEFLELTEQSQKLQIQFQQLQAGENLRNTSHTTTAADLVQAKQQVLAYQLQIEEQQLQIRNSQVKVDEYQLQIHQFKEQIIKMEKVACEHEGNVTQRIKEKEELIEQHSIVIKEQQNTIAELNEKLSASDMLLEDLGVQLQSKFQDLENLTTDLNHSRQREKQSSDEIKQLMGTVEELQKQYHKESQSEKEIIQRIDIDTQRKMEQLHAELDEMYGQQIVKIKQELNVQHRNEIDNLITKHRLELDLLISSGNASNQDQINKLTMTINELKEKLQETKQQKDHVKKELSEELAKVTDERTHLQRKVENLLQDLTSAKEELAKSSQSLLEQENKMNDIEKLKAAVEDLNESLVAAAETSKEMKCNYETEITTYKIKLEMLEREKDAVLGRMAESQEAELDKVRTQLLFSHEEELTKLKEDLKQESELSIENLKNELELKYKQNLEMMQTTLNEQLDGLKAERDCLHLEKENLLAEISKMSEKLCQQMENCKIEEMALKVMQLQAEIEELRKEEKEKGTLDQEIQELQAKNDVLQTQMKEKEDIMSRQISELTTENYLLKQSKEALEEKVQSSNLTGDLLEHSFASSLKEMGTEALSAQPQLQTLISENEDLKKYIAQLKEEIQTQKNTFSFAEKNFEVNYQELKDEYTCLLKVKADLEDQMVKETAKYQSDLKNLQMQIQDLQSSKVVNLPGSTLPESKELKGPEATDGEIIEKDATELMEKLATIQREKKELTSRLAETYEELNVKQNEINQLYVKLEALKAENEQTVAKCLELEQFQTKLQGDSFHNQNMEYIQSSVVTVSEAAENDMCTVKDHFQQIPLLEEKVSMLQGSLENAYVEIKKLHEEQVVLREDKESLLGELHVLKEKPNAETLALSAEPDREQLQQLLDSLRTEQLGLAKLVQQKTLVEESLQKKLHEKDKELVTLNEKVLILQEQLSKLNQEGCERELLEEDKKVKQHEQQFVSCIRKEMELSPSQMAVNWNVDLNFKLQMEAQHISLTQIYAAQLDLLRESLESEKECCLRRLEEDLTTCHRQEIKILKENYNKELNILKKQKTDFCDDLRCTHNQIRTLLKMTSEECKQYILSYKNKLGLKYQEVFQDKEDAKLKKAVNVFSMRSKESSDPHEVLNEVKDLHEDLQNLREQILWDYSCLEEFHTLLRTDLSKLDELQIAHDHLKCKNEEVSNVEAQKECLHDTKEGLDIQSAHLESIEQLKSNFSPQRAQIEDQHNQEMKLLQEYYQQQIKETNERYVTEITAHQKRVHSSEAKFSGSQIVLPKASSVEQQYAEEIKLEDVDLATDFRCSIKSFGLTHQLQTLRRALYAKYLQEVSALKDQHKTEVDILKQKHREEIESLHQQILKLTAHNQDQENTIFSSSTTAGLCADEQNKFAQMTKAMEKKHKEEIEEAIAKVIVQLSIEFAQQNELDRITFQERKTTSEVQTLSEELEGEALNKGPNETCPLENLSVVKEFEDEQLEDLRQELVRQDQEHQLIVEDLKHAHMQQLERQKEEQEKLLTEVKMLRSQLVKLTSVKASREAETQTAEETRLFSLSGKEVPKTQIRSTQTEMNEETQSGSQETETQSKPAEAHARTCEQPASDLVSFERNLLQKTNERLRQVLSDVLKTTAAMEETIGRHVEVLLDQSGKAVLHSTSEEPDKLCCTSIHASKPENYSEPSHANRTGEDDAHIWSGESGKSLEVSQEMNFPAEELDLENEVFMMSISTRLQAAVGKLLEAITETTTKLEHARITQTELMRESFRHNAEINELLQRQEELQELLCDETKEKEQLALELHKAEGIIDGYLDERTALEKQVQMKTDLILHLEQELHSTNSRLKELDEERQSIQQQRELLSRQQDAMKNSAGPRELYLLEETEKLMKEKVEVQLQAEKEHGDLLKQVKTLELELEEQINKVVELEQDKTAEVSDLRQQIQALEKQLEKNRKFLDQQAIDREHERDVFQQEIHKLEEQLKTPQKLQPCSEQNHTEIEILKKQVQHKTDQCSELLLQMDQFQRDIQERDEEIDKMSNRIRELENALINSSEKLQKMEVRKQPATSEVMLDSVLEAQLQTEREALDRKEKEISNLEEQLEQFREELENKNEEIQQLNMQMEIQRKTLGTQQQELENQNLLLKNEIASLQQSQHESENVSIDDHKLVIGKLSQVIHEKEQEVECLNEQVEKLQQQLEFSQDKKGIDKKNEQIKELESQVEFQRSDLERLKIKSEDEIEQLNEVIEKLQLELAHIENKSQDVYNSEEAQHMEKALVKMLKEEDSDRQIEKGSEEVNLPKEEFEAMKQNIYLTNQELEFLKGDRMRLLDKISHLEHSFAINEDSAHKVKMLEEVLQEKTATLLVIQAELNAVEESANSHITNLEAKLEELEFAVQIKDTEFNQYYVRAKDIENDNVVLQQKVLELEERLNQGTRSPSLNQASHSTLKKQSNINTKELYDKQGKNEEAIPEIVSIEMQAVAENILTVDGDSQKDEETQNSIMEESETKLNCLIVKLADLEEELTKLDENQELQRQLLYSTEKDKAEYEKKLAKLTVLLELMRKPAVEKEKMQRVLGSGKVPDSDMSDEENSSMSSVRLELEAVKSRAAATEEDLNYHRKQAEDLKGYLKEKELAILHLQDALQQVTEMNKGTTYDLQTELEEVKSEAAATKEELNSCREHAEKLKDEIQVREITIKQLQEERQQLKNSLAEAQEQLDSEILKSVGTSLDEKQKPENESNLTFFKDKSSLPRINASSQTDEAVTFGDNSVLEHAILKDSEVQIDFKDQNDSSEEIAEMIRSYTEKIGQMQELHAAEIMDMETRHICESESLKRDSHILREECKALNNMVAKMNSTEAVFASGFHSSSECKDEYASDSGSDLSQRLYLTSEPQRQEYRTIPEEEWRENEVFSSDVLPERIKNLLREVHQEGMQILSLSEASYPEEKPLSSDLFSETWQKERRALIDTVESLKILITKMQVHRKEEPSLDFASAQDHTDWRGDLLQAIQQIFQKEHGILKHTLISLAHSLETSDSMMCLNQLVHTINEQHLHHKEALEFLQKSDRRSLLMEIKQLQNRLHSVQQDVTQEEEGIHLLSLSINQDGQSQQSTPEIQQIVIKPESRQSMESIQELQELLQSERTLVTKLKTEIAQTKVELETTLKVQHKHLKEMEILRQDLTEKSAEIDVLNDVLASVQKKSRELHWVSEIEKCKSEQNQDRERGEMEDLEFPLEDQAYQNSQLGSSVEHEDQAVSLLKKQIEMEKALHESQLSHEKKHISELQVLLESERARAMELSNRLEQQKSLWSQLEKQTSQQATAERAVEGENIQEAHNVRPMEQLLVDLEDQLDEKHNRIVELVGDMEKYKLEIVQIKQQLDEEKQIHQADILKEKDACRILQEEVKQLRCHTKEVEEQLDKLKQQVFILQQERCGLQDKIKQIQDKKGPEDYQDKAEIQERSGGEKSQWEGDRTREWINQQKLPEVLSRDSSAPSLDEVNEEVPSPLNSKYLDNIFQRLHLFSSKLKTLANKASSKLNFETTDEEEFLWLQNSIQDVVSQLQQLTMIPPAEISGVVPNRSASGSLTERLLRQNAELTGFVSRLTEEKNDLRNSVIRLEEELRRYRQCSFGGYDYSNRKVLDNWDTLDVIHTDREKWAREKCNLEKSLRQAEAEVSKLRAELRNDALCREVAGSDGESAVLKRLYGKYLRAESFRKALIYQKKYLLLLLGGFQECERATLSLIARMGGHPSHTSLDIITHHCRAFIRFRSIVRVSIAVSRMKFLVRRWQRVTESGSISNSSINRNGFGHLPGSLETYGERRHTSRGRSGMESPRSALSVQNRYQSGPVDSNSGPLPCSNLQNYDPDRALTDYIHRLEALQRRLGSVPSGSTSYTQSHFGTRR